MNKFDMAITFYVGTQPIVFCFDKMEIDDLGRKTKYMWLSMEGTQVCHYDTRTAKLKYDHTLESKYSKNTKFYYIVEKGVK